MPSTHRDTRTYSWPPSTHHLASPTSSPLPDIDEDPYAHFISPVTDEDDALSLTAGIVPDSTNSKANSITLRFRHSLRNKWAKYVSRHHIELHELYHGAGASIETLQELDAVNATNYHDDDEDGDADNAADGPLEMAPRKRIESRLLGAEIKTREPTRGRAQDVLAEAMLRRRRGRRGARTLSGRRRSWREPSVGLFTVAEEEEGAEREDGGCGMKRRMSHEGEKERDERIDGRAKGGGEVVEKSRL